MAKKRRKKWIRWGKLAVCLLLSDGTPVFAPDAPSCLTAQTVEALPDTGGHIELTDSSGATQLLFYSPLSLECGTLYLLKITPAGRRS